MTVRDMRDDAGARVARATAAHAGAMRVVAVVRRGPLRASIALRARIFVGRCAWRRYDGGIAATGGVFFPRGTTWRSRTD
jgi:hypothetical protein